MAIGIGQIFIQTAIGGIFGQYFGALFGGPSQQETDERIRRNFTEFLTLISRDFSATVEGAIREAFLDHSFEQIKADSITAMNLFCQHCHSITPAAPRGELASLDNAAHTIERAYAALQVACDRICQEALPERGQLDYAGASLVAILPPGPNPTRESVETKTKAIKIAHKRFKLLTTSLMTVMSIRLLILAKRAEGYPGLRNSLTQNILPRLQEMVQRLDQLGRRIQPLRIKNICIREGCYNSHLAGQVESFQSIIQNTNRPGPANDEQHMGIIEYTYDDDSKTRGLLRYTATNRVRHWGLSRRYGPGLLFPSRWHGAILLPTNQEPTAALPTIDQPGTSRITPFNIENLPSCGPPFTTHLLEMAKAQMVSNLTATYEAEDYATLQQTVGLAQAVANQLPAQ